MSKQLKTIQYTVVNIAEVDTTDYMSVKSAISALYYNIHHVYPTKSLDRVLSFIGIVYLAKKFNDHLRASGKAHMTTKEYNGLVQISAAKYRQIRSIMEHYDYDMDAVQKTIEKHKFYFITDLYNHCFAEITYKENGERVIDYPTKNNQDQKARYWSKKMPIYIQQVIGAVKGYRENLASMPEDMQYYLSKIQRYVTWYIPTVTKCDNAEYLEYGYCCRCGEQNESMTVPYKVTNYYSSKLKRDINIALCKGCSLPHASKSVNETYIMLNYIDYAKTLERIVDGKFGQRETFSKHFCSIIKH